MKARTIQIGALHDIFNGFVLTLLGMAMKQEVDENTWVSR